MEVNSGGYLLSRFLVEESSVSLSCKQLKTFRGTYLVAKVSFLQLLCEFCLDFETMLQNIRCFIVYIVIIVLVSFPKQGIVVSFFALEYEVTKIK